MIQPKDRSTLTEALIPPAGYTFDTGVATTYSLDLGTLMALPLQLAWLATSDDIEGRNDPIRLLEGLRRTTKRLSVFSDRGRMHVPRLPHALMGLMEEMIYEVSARHGGAFHPKVWALRFLSDDPRKVCCIRLLILSRNLTEDRSWDLNLCLEGRPKGGIHKQNREIADFIRRLPEWSAKPLSTNRIQDIESLASDLHRCEWELPGSFEEVVFHVLGVGPKPKPFSIAAADETVIVSPFLSDGAIQSIIGKTGAGLALVSRSEELALLSAETRSKFHRVDVLNDDADSGSEEEVLSSECRGLHAKAIVQRRGWWTNVFVGSANCTNAAMLNGTNVEVVAELIGRHSRVGGPADWVSERGMGPLLLPYVPVDTTDIMKQKKIDDALEICRKALMLAELTLDCEKAEGGHRLKMIGTSALEDIDAEFWAWPLSVPSGRQVGLTASPVCELGIFASQDVTSLIGFRIRIDGGELSFGVELPLANPPLDREAGVLALILRNRAAFLRYLTLLLSEADDSVQPGSGEDGHGLTSFGGNGEASAPLFELLVKAFSRSPEKLAQVGSAIRQLEQAEADSGEKLVPDEFLKVWRTLEAARKLDLLS